MAKTTTSSVQSRISKPQTASTTGGPPLLRQWQLLDLLSTHSQGLTVIELARVTGTSLKTVRRDLDFFKKLGFHLVERVQEHGQKVWRVARAEEKLTTRRQRYGAVLQRLDDLIQQGQSLDDQPLVRALRDARRNVARKCR